MIGKAALENSKYIFCFFASRTAKAVHRQAKSTPQVFTDLHKSEFLRFQRMSDIFHQIIFPAVKVTIFEDIILRYKLGHNPVIFSNSAQQSFTLRPICILGLND